MFLARYKKKCIRTVLCSIIALHGKYTKIWDQYKSTIYIVHLRFISKFSIGPSFVMDRYIRVMFKVMHIVWDQGSKQTFVSTFCIRNRNKSGHTFWSPTKTFAQTFWMRRKILLKHDGCEASCANILDAKHYFCSDILGANQCFGSNIWGVKNWLCSNILNVKKSLFNEKRLFKHHDMLWSLFLSFFFFFVGTYTCVYEGISPRNFNR